MAFNAQQEDYQRLALRFARTLSGTQADNVRRFATFGRRFAHDRDSLPQTDADRAFHLVVEATTLVDYELPFATEEAAETIATRAHRLLEEAVSLDECCFDALRMLQAGDATSFEGQYRFLLEQRDEVRRRCEEAVRRARLHETPERGELGASLALAPYLRWMAALSEKALICGHNRETLRYVGETLEIDPDDHGDLCLTAAYASAKLEDERGLDLLANRLRRTGRRSIGLAWLRLARACLAHRRRDVVSARKQLRHLVGEYPHAAVDLARQNELPEGVFARLPVPPRSEDELIVAISEGTILLQEGRDTLGMGTFGSWTMHEALNLMTEAQLGEVPDLVDLRGEEHPS